VQPVGIQSVSASETYISGAKWILFKVTLTASKDDILVTASSGNPAALAFNGGATESKWVWGGSASRTASFFLKPGAVSSPTPVTLTATANGQSKSLTYTVQP